MALSLIESPSVSHNTGGGIVQGLELLFDRTSVFISSQFVQNLCSCFERVCPVQIIGSVFLKPIKVVEGALIVFLSKTQLELSLYIPSVLALCFAA